jgi:hypothetical protein
MCQEADSQISASPSVHNANGALSDRRSTSRASAVEVDARFVDEDELRSLDSRLHQRVRELSTSLLGSDRVSFNWCVFQLLQKNELPRKEFDTAVRPMRGFRSSRVCKATLICCKVQDGCCSTIETIARTISSSTFTLRLPPH